MRVEVTGDRIEITLALAMPREETWRLLTEARHIRAWWGGHASLDARLGGPLREVWSNGNREVVTAGVVTRFDPQRTLAMSWADDDWPGETQVTFTVADRDGATEMTLVHSGWAIHPPERRSTLMEAHAQG
ncbi:SRPBCC family protein [Chelativorans salis]|uniref:SRPBCC domain-containing protein n=1 Tax=Chelativorans salis TaxID=2978478 RepID=A0ABT2LNQ0_9HYPH|nr:SRPBCC domain-containing protein [Chelativorans sp. EGI FJ00035]MCT7376163.1 SRPBCC domain-containing protein [Chelativorans sp. EGI FJ00035]